MIVVYLTISYVHAVTAEIFHPKRIMKLNDEECNLPIYILDSPPNEKIELAIIFILYRFFYKFHLIL